MSEKQPGAPAASGSAAPASPASAAIPLQAANDQNEHSALPSPPRLAEQKSAAHVIVDEKAELPEITIQVIPSAVDINGEADVLVRLHVPDASYARPPADVCCIIDVSGSMSDEATRQDLNDPNLRHNDGFNVLDIVKHAVKAVVKSLEKEDRLTLVVFSSSASVKLPLTQMSEQGKTHALQALEALQPGGSTNLWDGLRTGLDTLRLGSANRRKTAMLLTDGQPDAAPGPGYIALFKQYLDQHPGFSSQLHMFGFGYNLDSELLLQFAQEGGGLFSFIPDAPIVGAVFVHSIANILSTHTQHAILHLTAPDGASFVDQVRGCYPVTDASWGRVINVSPLQLGQQRDVIVRMKLPADPSLPFLEATLEYGDDAKQKVSVEAKERAVDGAALACAVVSLRADLIEACNTALTSISNAQLSALVAKADASPFAGDEVLIALKKDAGGRAHKALDGEDRFNRWGKHFLRALMRAHQLQQCTNFMDPGLQVYGGLLFAHLRSQGDRIYLSLPPPKPSNSSGSSYAAPSVSASSAAASPPAAAISNYYDSSGGGGCFGESSSVLRVCQASGEYEKASVSSVQAGDELVVADGTARVICVVKVAHVPGKCKSLVRLPSGLTITPSHPIRLGGNWVRPDTIGDPVSMSAMRNSNSSLVGGWVYNFVLDRSHVLLVNGVECVTLGHGLNEAGVKHEYWGSRVLNDLHSHSGWSMGVVEVFGFLKDASRHVIGLLA